MLTAAALLHAVVSLPFPAFLNIYLLNRQLRVCSAPTKERKQTSLSWQAHGTEKGIKICPKMLKTVQVFHGDYVHCPQKCPIIELLTKESNNE